MIGARQNKLLFFILISFAILSLWAFLSFFQWTHRINLAFNRLFQNIYYNQYGSSPSLNDITIVRIDDTSYQAIGMKWPWPRTIIRQAIEKIQSFKPKCILMNYTMMGRSPYGERDDEEFASTLRKSRNIILASYFTLEGQEIKPLDIISKASAGAGFINVPLELDDRVHDYWMFLINQSRPGSSISIALKSYLFIHHLKASDIQYNLSKSSFQIGSLTGTFESSDVKVPIHFRAKPEDFTRVSLIDVLEDSIQSEKFHNRIVMIGNDGLTFQEFINTPLGMMSGVYIIANQLLNLLDGEISHKMSWVWDIMIFLFTLFVGTFLFLKIAPRVSLPIGIVCVCLYLLLCYSGFAQHTVWNYANPLVLFIIQYLAFQIFYIVAFLKLSARVKRFAVTDWLTQSFTYRYFNLLLLKSFPKLLKSSHETTLILMQCTSGSDNDLKGLSQRVKKRFPRRTLWARFDVKQLMGWVPNTTPQEACNRLFKTKETLQGLARISHQLSTASAKSASSASPASSSTLSKTRRGGSDSVGPAQHTVKYASHALGHLPRIQSRLDALVTKPDEKTGLGTPDFIVGLVGLKESQITHPAVFLKAAQMALERAQVLSEGVYIFRTLDMTLPAVSAEPVTLDDLKSDVAYIQLDIAMRERELEHMRKSLDKAYEDRLRLEKLSAAGEMAARFYHEVNNPVTNIQMCLQNLEKDLSRNAENRPNTLETIVSEVHRLARLTKQMLSFFRPVDEQSKVSVSINQLIDEILILSEPKLRAQGIQIKRDFQNDLPPVKCSSDQIKVVFLNLVVNAIDAMGQGGILSVKSLSSIQASECPRVQIVFKDSGVGIPEDCISRIFEPFFTTKGEKGTGLGLSTCYNIVKSHHGEISVKSTVGKGTEFLVQLPTGKI